MGYLLGIETSCDETAAAVYDFSAKKIISNAVFSQVMLHEKYGGVVPEIASRSHLEKMGFIVRQALDECKLTIGDIDSIAVTNKPGLAGSLLIGLCFAKGLAFAHSKNIIAIDHLEGHVFSSFLQSDGSVRQDIMFPHVCLVASGGHTSFYLVEDFGKYKLLGQTLDDAAFLTYAFTSFFQQHIAYLQQYSTLTLSSIVIFVLIIINIAGAHIGGAIQIAFFSMKFIPILFALTFGTTLFQIKNLPTRETISLFSSAISTVPIALYALMGFEITCAIGHLIKKPEKNIFRSIVYSFLIVAVAYSLFQLIVYLALGTEILSPGQPFTRLANKVFVSHPMVGKGITSLVFASVISGAFGILTSNCWNLHALAQDNYLPGAKFIKQVSQKKIPIIALLLEGILACLFLVISKNQIALQSMSVFGVVAAFLISAFAALRAIKPSDPRTTRLLSIVSIISCCYILFLCFEKIANAGVSIPYIIVLMSGITVGAYSSLTKRRQ